MSLDFNLKKINNWEEVCYLPENEDGDQYINPVTETIIFYTAFVRVYNITEANWQDVYKRFALWERLFGPTVMQYDRAEDGSIKRTPQYITPEDVFNHIGLGTNGGDETEAAYKKRAITQFFTEKDNELKRFVNKLNELNSATV